MNKEGLVAVVSEYATFGDIQSLLITILETSAEDATTPNYISTLTISTDKKIKITTAPFYEQQMIMSEEMNSDSKSINTQEIESNFYLSKELNLFL
ncbi:hypothetical protein [Enterococcus casseliflavus]|uniref:hypothetical protein n=1 Tax=Enterococcus casseliflavus TaxID=37734 RepID=UPI0039A5552D